MSASHTQLESPSGFFARLQRGFLFVLMSLLTVAMFAEVITRYFFDTSLFGLEQFIGYAAVWLYFIGAAYGTLERSHIKAEFIGVLVKNRRNLLLIRSLSGVISTAMSIVFTKWSYDFCLDSLKMKETSPTMGVPMIIFQSALFLSGLIMTFYFFMETLDYLRQAAKAAKGDG